jgi:hypothetical protein
MPSPNDDKLLRMDGWPGGVNNRMRETERNADTQYLRQALNVDLTAEGHPLRRRGYALHTAGYAHSVSYQNSLFFVVIDGSLLVGPKVDELTSITAVNKYLRMSYTVHADEVYFSNSVNSGKYTSTGLVAWPGPDQTYTIHDDEELELTDNLYETMPIGQHIASYNGRIWTARRDEVWFSEGMSTHMCRKATNYFMMPGYVYMMLPAEDGIYIGTESGIYFLRGDDPFQMAWDGVYAHGVVPFAYTELAGEKFGLADTTVPVWWTKDGVMSAGLPGGEVRPLTRDRLAAPEYGFGALSIREREGISQVVSALQKGGDANNMGATDTVVAEIRTS